jgi:hypothetical protein
MEQTECSETSAYKGQTPGNYPEEKIQHTKRTAYRTHGIRYIQHTEHTAYRTYSIQKIQHIKHTTYRTQRKFEIKLNFLFILLKVFIIKLLPAATVFKNIPSWLTNKCLFWCTRIQRGQKAFDARCFSVLFLVSSDFCVIVCVNLLHVPVVEPLLEKSQSITRSNCLKVAYMTNVL